MGAHDGLRELESWRLHTMVVLKYLIHWGAKVSFIHDFDVVWDAYPGHSMGYVHEESLNGCDRRRHLRVGWSCSDGGVLVEALRHGLSWWDLTIFYGHKGFWSMTMSSTWTRRWGRCNFPLWQHWWVAYHRWDGDLFMEMNMEHRYIEFSVELKKQIFLVNNTI